MTVPANQVVDREKAYALSADACRDHALAGWIVMRDQPQPGAFMARFIAGQPTPYVLVAETLAELRAQLPDGLTLSERQPSDPLGLVEIWFTG